MENRDPYLNLSPLDHRYWKSNPIVFEELSTFLSEKAAVRYHVRAELALLKVHIRRHLDSKSDLLDAIVGLESRISAEEIAVEEEKTNHNIRALVNVIQRHIPKELGPWVHLGATSMDILDTAMAMRIRDALWKTVLPLIIDLLDILIRVSEEHAETVQAGRTHGQWAVPITFGFAMSEYVSRLGQSIEKIAELSGNLRGKLSGAVGAYNATSLISNDPAALEEEFLGELGLKRADYANQIVEPEHLLRLLLEMNVCFGIIANLADDLRHLQRSEIAEVNESFGKDQVGSSTMPQKRNPWNCEHVKSLWKAYCPRVMTFYMDQISEHQRDLSNSASGRFITEYIAGFSAAVARMKQIADNLVIRKDRMQQILSNLGDAVLAEPTYILLALSGYPDAHEIVRKITLKANANNESIRSVLKQDKDIWKILSSRLQAKLGIDAAKFYSLPEFYTGIATSRARELAGKYRNMSAKIRKRLEDNITSE